VKKFSFELIKKDKTTRARAGIIHTPHGDIETPAFSVVGTKASVKGLDETDLKNAGSQVVLANTYHLYLRPGVDVIKKFGGLRKFMRWDGPMITDSGGYQVSFLWEPRPQSLHSSVGGQGGKVKIIEEGAIFRSHIDGSKHLLTPEKSMEIQSVLGADIIMALDQPMGNRFTEKQNKGAFERTLRWEERSYVHWKKLETNQALFGIIQGQTDKKLRTECLKFLLDMDFPGLAIGGEEIGVDPARTAASLDTIVDLLPDDKPLHALGLGGGPEGIFEAVARGVDIFDNSSVTRLARTGLLFIYPEDGGNKRNKFRVNIKNSKYKNNKKPISKECSCHTCENYSAAYINLLLLNNESLGVRLATIHNVQFINSLMYEIRKNVISGRFNSLKKHWLGRLKY
jgi:tRNA-guanine transglycosylase